MLIGSRLHPCCPVRLAILDAALTRDRARNYPGKCDFLRSAAICLLARHTSGRLVFSQRPIEDLDAASGGDAHDQFAKILSVEKTDEGVWRVFQPFNDVFPVFQPAIGNPG